MDNSGPLPEHVAKNRKGKKGNLKRGADHAWNAIQKRLKGKS